MNTIIYAIIDMITILFTIPLTISSRFPYDSIHDSIHDSLTILFTILSRFSSQFSHNSLHDSLHDSLTIPFTILSRFSSRFTYDSGHHRTTLAPYHPFNTTHFHENARIFLVKVHAFS